MADCVGATKNRMQPATPHGARYRRIGVAEPKKLNAGYDAELPLRQARNRVVLSYFLPHSGKKYDRGDHSPRGNICSPL